ncbi:MAG: rRNA maturation RNase YbeY [Bacteroidales bacterium]|jgi:rRNA maturation RNase YbeY|nr:rRNA maturation RNase YbeY [Bacteroidales bacterium]
MTSTVTFFVEDIDFKLSDKMKIRRWLRKIIIEEGYKTGEVNYIFCSDEYLSKLNLQYLNHKTLTDIITFDYSERNIISGDIFISIERVRENAVKFAASVQEELLRVIAHGVLHLCGYKDKSEEEQKLMRQKEDEKLINYQNINE